MTRMLNPLVGIMSLISSDEDKTKPAYELAVCDMSRCYCSLNFCFSK